MRQPDGLAVQHVPPVEQPNLHHARAIRVAIAAGVSLHGLERQLLHSRSPLPLAAVKLGPQDEDLFVTTPADNGKIFISGLAAGRIWMSVRRLGRWGLKLLRPAMLPFLHRFEWRIRTSVDKSDVAIAMSTRISTLFQIADLTQLTLTAEVAESAHRFQILKDLVKSAKQEVDERTNLRQDEINAAIQRSDAAMAELRDSMAALAAQTAKAHAALLLSGDRLLSRGVVALSGTDYLVRTPSGWLVAPGEDERLLMAMVESGGVIEAGTVAVITALLAQGDTMVDVGAHIGTITLPAALAVGERGRIIAIEPTPRTVGLLRRGMHINSVAERVTIHACAAGAAHGEAILNLAQVLGENTLVSGIEGSGTEGSEAVVVRPLDDMVPPGPVSLIKIDAEGYELEIWKGMNRVFADSPDLVVVIEFGAQHLVRADIAPETWFDAIWAQGFTAWEINERTGHMSALRPIEQLDAVFSMNVLLLRRPPSAYPQLCWV